MTQEIERITHEDSRFYIVGGQYFPSVTTILDAFPKGHQLVKWVGDNGNMESNRIKTLAGQKGTIVHNSIERLLDGDKLDYRDFEEDEWDYLQGFTNFCEDYKPQTIEKEHTIISYEKQYAGTMDWSGFVYKKGEKLFARVDWKTSNYIHDEYDIQLSAYDAAEVEAGKPAADILLIVQLGTKTKRKYSVHEVKDKDTHLECFNHVYWLWKYLHPNAKPYQKDVPASLSLPKELTSKLSTSTSRSKGGRKKTSRKELSPVTSE